MTTKLQNTLTLEAEALAQQVHLASRALRKASSADKNAALRFAAEVLLARSDEILAANARDLERGKAAGLSAALLDRLMLNPARLKALAEGLAQIVALPDPVGQELSSTIRPNGLRLRQVRVPIGVILIVFESRPNVTLDAGALCLKSGNACILRGGSEAEHSNRVLAEVLQSGLEKARLPGAAVSIPATTDREWVGILLQQDRYIDLAIPRGGEELIRRVSAQAKMPVLKHYQGICHVYVDVQADRALARKIVVNSKLQRVSVCNAAETLLVHASVAELFLPEVARELVEKGCELRAEAKAAAILRSAGFSCVDADRSTFYNEYLEPILSVKVVDSLDDAIEHIEMYGSRHTDTIVTEDPAAGARFQQEVDSSSVFVNVSTRLADGFEYGLGAEIGIATDKLHARGPMGLAELTTYKWLGEGPGILKK